MQRCFKFNSLFQKFRLRLVSRTNTGRHSSVGAACEITGGSGSRSSNGALQSQCCAKSVPIWWAYAFLPSQGKARCDQIQHNQCSLCRAGHGSYWCVFLLFGEMLNFQWLFSCGWVKTMDKNIHYDLRVTKRLWRCYWKPWAEWINVLFIYSLSLFVCELA